VNGSYSYTRDPGTAGGVNDVFTYTIKDGDGDLSHTTLTISIGNSTPTITGLTPAAGGGDVTVNEDDLLASRGVGESAGSDISKESLTQAGTFTISSPDGIKSLTIDGHTVISNGVFTATSFTTSTLSNTLSVTGYNAATGVVSYSYTLLDNETHAPGAGTNSLFENLAVALTDQDNQTANDTLVATIIDDVPTAVVPDHAELLNVAGNPFPFSLDNDLTLSNNFGADGGTVVFLPSLNGTPSGLTSHGTSIIYNVSPDGHILTGVAGPTTVFVITLDPATATYSVDMNDVVDSTTRVDFDAGAFNFVGGNNEWAEFIPVGETVGTPIDNNSSDLLLTPQINHQFASSINSNNGSGGVGTGGNVGPAQTLRVDFVTDLRGNPASTGPGDYGVLSKRDHVFDGHYTTNGASATFTATSGATVNIRAFDDPDGENVVGPGVNPDPLTGIAILFGNNPPLFIDLTKPFGPSHIIGGHTFTLTIDGVGGINVGGVFGDNTNTTSIAVFTSNGYNSLEYTYVSGDPFKIGNFGASVPSTDPVNFDVPIQVVDSDGDAAGSSIGVTLSTPVVGAPTVTISDDEPGTASIAGGSILYTFQFSETVTAFDAGDITVVNGTKGTFTAVDGDTYTLAVTPMADFQGILAVGVAAGVAFDAAVTPNTAAALSVQVVDTLAPVASIILDAITADNIVNAAEAGGTVAVTGTVGGDGQVGDTVTLTVNGNSSYTGLVQAGLTFSIDVAGSDLAADTNVHASVNTTDAAGNTATASDDQAYAVDTAGPSASLNLTANFFDLLTQTNRSSGVIIQFSEPVIGFGPDNLTASNGTLVDFGVIDGATYIASFQAPLNFEGTGQVTLTGPYTDLAGNPGVTGATDTVDINTLASTLDATILTTGTSGVGQTVALTFVDLQDPTFSWAGLFDLGAQGGTFLTRDVGFDINPSKEYAVSLEATGEIPVPISVLTVEGVTIHVIEGAVTLELDNDNSIILDQTALTSIVQATANQPPRQIETASVDGNELANNGLVDPTITPGPGAGSAENSVNYLYSADGQDDLTGSDDTDVLNGGAGNDTYLAGAGNDILIYDPVDQKIDGGGGTDVLRSDEAAFGLLNNVGVLFDAATGFDLVEVVPFKQNIKNIEVLLITDDAESSPTKGGLLNLTAQDVLDITDPIDHTLTVLGNPGDVVNIGIGASAWNKSAPDASGFQTYSQNLNGINLLLHVEHTIVVT
jgi:plastocyanin